MTVKLIEDHQRTALFNKLSCFYENTKDLPKSKHQYVIEKLSASKDFKRKAAELLLELRLLDIEGSIITIDAIGTQTDIAKRIIEEKADYILAVKGNQHDLLDQIQGRFAQQSPCCSDTVMEKGHGRIETRTCQVITKLDFVDDRIFWKGLKSIVKITSSREINQKISREVRYYISSLDASSTEFNKFIRQHWGIENKLHWSLDMVFNEDRQRKRNKNAANNFSYIRKIALNTLKKDTSKGSLVTKRLKAGWDNKFLLTLLNLI